MGVIGRRGLGETGVFYFLFFVGGDFAPLLKVHMSAFLFYSLPSVSYLIEQPPFFCLIFIFIFFGGREKNSKK